jgi:hypothetical protein
VIVRAFYDLFRLRQKIIATQPEAKRENHR